MEDSKQPDFWLDQLFQAQEIRLTPPCKQRLHFDAKECEVCPHRVCQQAGVRTAEALKLLAESGYPKFVLGH